MSRYVIDGMYWRAGDDIYIDTQNDDADWVVVCLNDFIKDHIEENTNITIVIDVKEKH